MIVIVLIIGGIWARICGGVHQNIHVRDQIFGVSRSSGDVVDHVEY
ncbi:hypothetical protein BZL29_8475 [Mycobacterium kansasii]|uniref:Uncharacterized protein n=1 Tax=Mycobacterium kansasii TaxID=1768 RepID=A0A1V3WA75_MYCKA|nr:hypothetical protein BZL29_8475 [Mycobacterium kansasii]